MADQADVTPAPAASGPRQGARADAVLRVVATITLIGVGVQFLLAGGDLDRVRPGHNPKPSSGFPDRLGREGSCPDGPAAGGAGEGLDAPGARARPARR